MMWPPAGRTVPAPNVYEIPLVSDHPDRFTGSEPALWSSTNSSSSVFMSGSVCSSLMTTAAVARPQGTWTQSDQSTAARIGNRCDRVTPVLFHAQYRSTRDGLVLLQTAWRPGRGTRIHIRAVYLILFAPARSSPMVRKHRSRPGLLLAEREAL